ncbi:MAG: translation elongation factor Ts [Actinobacteria bacterium]|nr:translation elongation factor Ts [Actinomycetota bacterium]
MSAIGAQQVKELREATGAGMMDCKRALQETAGDFDAARTLLRERGMAQAGKRAGRETSEGKVDLRTLSSVGTIAAVGCETEPVSNTGEFLAFAERVLDVVESGGADAVQELEAERTALIAKIGENVVVRGAARLEARDGEHFGHYVHTPAKKIGVLVKVRGGSGESARRLAMHVASAAPSWARREDVPAELVEAERSVYLGSDEVQSKPEQAREKIVEGMLGKRFFGAYPGGVLLDQAWIHDSGSTVARALEQEGMELVEFVRYSVSE